MLADADQTYTVMESYRVYRKNMKKWAGALRSYPMLEVKQCMVRESGSYFQSVGELMNRRRCLAWARDSALMLV